MTQYSTVTLLPETVYGTASGNYDGSSQDFYGDVKPAGNYYGGQGNLQTVAYRVSNFTGFITVQATLQTDPLQAAWFDVDVYGDGSTVIPTDYHPVNVVGNFAWLRVKVTGFDSGTIQSVTASY
jgi:hypothetical protein